MPIVERRLLPRRAFTVPVRYRVLGNDANQMLTGESLNWSDRGVFFTTKHALKVGMPLEMFLKIPYQAGNAASPEVRCAARVVHVKPNVGPDRQSGVGVFVERFEPSVAEAPTQT